MGRVAHPCCDTLAGRLGLLVHTLPATPQARCCCPRDRVGCWGASANFYSCRWKDCASVLLLQERKRVGLHFRRGSYEVLLKWLLLLFWQSGRWWVVVMTSA